MRKTITMVLMALLFTLQATAIQPLPRFFTDRQSDGTTITVRAHGDGHVAFYTTVDDQILVRNSDGDLCYAVFMGNQLVPSSYLAHNPSERSATEQEFLKNDNTRAQRSKLAQLSTRRAPFGPQKAIGTSTSDGLGHYGISASGAVKSIGNYTIPVIMVQFSDVKFKSTTTVEKMQRFYNEEGYHDENGCVGSVRDYFKAQSRGMFVPTFDVVGIVTLNNNVEYYGGNVDYWGNSYDAYLLNNYSLVKEAVEAASKSTAQGGLGVNFSNYKDGTSVPLVAILYAGKGEATEDQTADNEKYIWPCELDVNSTFSDVKFRSFFVGNELYTGGRDLMGMGVFVHEFGHALGLPDFYCTDGSYSGNDAMSNWSIMDTGPYVNDARAPIGYNAYERSYMGWLDIPEADDFADAKRVVTLTDPNADEGTMAVRISTSDKKIYYLLENRQEGTWYPSNMGHGLLVTRVSYNGEAWSGNYLNNTESRQRIKVITADGATLYYSGSQGNLFGYRVKEIETLPAYSGGDFTLDPAISDITCNSDHTVTFQYGFPQVVANEWGIFSRVQSDEEIVEGKRYLIVYEVDKQTAQVFSGIGGNGTSTYGAKVMMNIQGTYIDNTNLEGRPVILEKAESGNWYIRLGDVYLAYDKTNESGYNYLYTKDNASDDGTEWIVTSTAIQSAFNTDRYLQYNTSSTATRFSCYKGTQKNVVLYKETEYETVEVPTDAYGFTTLYYGDRNLIVPEGVVASTYYFDEQGQLDQSAVYNYGSVIPATTAVVVEGVADRLYAFAVTTREGNVDDLNLLRGTDEDALTTGGDQYFMLSLPESSTDASLIGFYWGAEDGAAFTNPAHRAYLPLTSDQVGDAEAFLLDGRVITGIREIELFDKQRFDDAAIYDLQGRRITTPMLLRPGIYVRGGRKFVVK